MGKFEGVAAEIGEFDDVIALVVMTEDDQTLSELLLRREDAGIGFRFSEMSEALGENRLKHMERLG